MKIEFFVFLLDALNFLNYVKTKPIKTNTTLTDL